MPQNNYAPDPSGTVSTDSYGNLGNLRGHGNPNGVVYGRTGWSYYDLDSDDVYFNTGDGRNTTWTAFAGSGSVGAGGALPTVGDPEGVLTADNLQLAWDSTNNILYIHEGADGTNTGWRELIA